MIGSILQFVSLAVQILASLVTIFFPFYSSKENNVKKNVNRFITRKFSYSPLGHEEIYPFYKWLLGGFFCVCITTTSALLYMEEVPNYYPYTTIITFAIMLIGFIFLSINGKRSLETPSVIAPKKLWQIIFKKIPSYLEECDGPLKICLVDIGVRRFPEQAKERNTLEDNDIGGRAIENAINKKKKELKACAPELTPDDRDSPLYTITENNLFIHKSDKETIHGIIAFIGDELAIDEVGACLHFLAEKFPNAPIGYLSYGSYPSSNKFPPYINLRDAKPGDYVNHLIFRYYTRSRAWQSLSKAYRKFFLWLVVSFVFLLFAIPGHLLLGNFRAERSKMTITAYEKQENESNLTRLVNALLVSPMPIDVKIWEYDSLSDRKSHNRDSLPYVNKYRYSKQGRQSHSQSDSSLIASVMKASVFLVYDRKISCPYKVWDSQGRLCEGYYNPASNAFYTSVNGQDYIFKWIPKKSGKPTMDDFNIRTMYSYDGKNAVEIIYSRENRDKVWESIRHSDTYLLGIQQFLIAATLNGLTLNNPLANNKDVQQRDSAESKEN